MNLRFFLIGAWRSLRELVASPIIFARLKQKYPTCHFYPGSRVDELSVLGKYNVIFKNTCIINSVLSDHTFVQKNSMVMNADIGKFCSIASGVCISLGQHPTSHVSSHPAFYSATQPLAKTFSNEDRFEPFDKRTKVGNDVWIGQNAMVMDGVRIGTGAVVAAGAVVTKDVPAYAIAGGAPAKLIRYRFDEEIREKLLETKWWDWTEEQLAKYIDCFSNVNLFLNLWEETKLQK